MSIVTPVAIANAAADELPKIFGDALENTRRGQPDFIANGDPQSVTGQIAQAVARSSCRAFGAGNLNLSADKAGKYEEACRPYLDGIDPGNGVKLVTPIQGLQCPGVRYRYFYNVISEDGTVGPRNDITCASNRYGPILLRRVDVPPRGVQWFLSSADVNGVRAETLIVSSNTRATVSVTSIGRCDGQQDLCGNQPPIAIPIDPIPDPTGPQFRLNPGPNLDVTVNVQVGPSGEINFNIGTGPITVDPFPEPAPDGGDPGGGGGTPPVPGEPGPGSETGGGGGGGTGGEAGGDAPPGKVLTGVRVDILGAPPSRRRYTVDVDRGVGYVYMGTPSEGLGLDPTGATVRSGQFFFAQKEYLTRWLVRANNGYNLLVIPFFKDAPE